MAKVDTTFSEVDRGRRQNWLPSAMFIVAFCAAIIIYARLDSLLGADMRIVAFLAIAAMAAFGVVRCLANGNIGAASISIGAGLYVFFNMYVFGATFGTAINPNAAFAFIPLTCTALFKWILDALGAKRVSGKLYGLAIAYAVIYLALSIVLAVSPSSLSQAAREALVLGDGAGFRADARADRIVGYLSLLAFGWIFAVTKLRRRLSLFTLAIAALFIVCIALTNSRTYIFCIICVTVLVILVRNPAKIFSICMAAVFLVTIFYFYCIFVGCNPFSVFEYDASGAARIRSFDTAAYWINQLPWFGVGTAPSGEVEAYYVVGQSFSLTDLGPVGILYSSGFVGLALWFGLPLIRHIRSMSKFDADSPLYLAIAIMMLYQIIAPVLWYGGGTMLFALWLAMTLRMRPSS